MIFLAKMYSTFLFAKIYEEKRKDISLKIFNAMNEGRIFFIFHPQMFHVKHFNENFISDII